jgi:hypothetical protein
VEVDVLLLAEILLDALHERLVIGEAPREAERKEHLAAVYAKLVLHHHTDPPSRQIKKALT